MLGAGCRRLKRRNLRHPNRLSPFSNSQRCFAVVELKSLGERECHSVKCGQIAAESRSHETYARKVALEENRRKKRPSASGAGTCGGRSRQGFAPLTTKPIFVPAPRLTITLSGGITELTVA